MNFAFLLKAAQKELKAVELNPSLVSVNPII